MSKDGRYIQQCQGLLLKLISFLFERKESLVKFNPERKLELQQARKHTTWVISCILYMLVSAKTGRTLGMKALGMNFMTENNVATKSQSHEVIGIRQRRRFIFLCISLLSAATGSLVLEYFAQDSGEHEKDSQLDQGDQERSRGRERRLIHERLRQQMLERAANLGGTSTAFGGSNISNQQTLQQTELERKSITILRRSTSSSRSERFLTIIRQLSKFVFQVYSNSDGPHNIVQQTDSENENESRSTAYSIALWIARLHLAHFLLTGKYPTLVHRFLGLEPSREKSIDGRTKNVTPRSTILDRPNTNRAIAVVLLLQVSSSLLKSSSNWFAEKVAAFLEARSRRRTIDQKSSAQLTKAQLRKKLDKVFDNNNRTVDSSTSKRSKKGDKETTILCTICRMERKHPAAPSSCGHVMCWNCLIQWVSTVRPECPICRAPCTAKDVLPLYNYDPIL